MSPTDPQFLALAALGEQGGTAPDAAHLAGCAECRLHGQRLTRIQASGGSMSHVTCCPRQEPSERTGQ